MTPELPAISGGDDTHSTAAQPAAVRARRKPVQERSTETVLKINDAASRLLAKGLPVEDLTTAQIAAEAGVAVGSLYRFFPDKQAIVDALAVRRLEEFQTALMQQIMPALIAPNGPALLAEVIDIFVAFIDSHLDFRTIAYGGRHISRRTREEHSSADSGAIALVRQYMIAMLGFADTPDLELRLRVVIEAGDRLLAFALEQDSVTERARIISEMKHLISQYLFPQVPREASS